MFSRHTDKTGRHLPSIAATSKIPIECKFVWSHIESAPVLELQVTPVQPDTSVELSQPTWAAQDAFSSTDAAGEHI